MSAEVAYNNRGDNVLEHAVASYHAPAERGGKVMASQYSTPSRRVDCVCEFCGASFTLPRCRLKLGMGRVCEACRHPSVEERFWRRVKKTDGCWEWQGSRHPNGHGYFSAGRASVGYAHRAAWEFVHGPIPFGLFVCHHCDNPPCVRPDHLFLGTQNDNVQDAVSKGRMSRGESHHAAKLTEAAVREIRVAEVGWTQSRQSLARALAPRYGVTSFAVKAVLQRNRWRHIA